MAASTDAVAVRPVRRGNRCQAHRGRRMLTPYPEAVPRGSGAAAGDTVHAGGRRRSTDRATEGPDMTTTPQLATEQQPTGSLSQRASDHLWMHFTRHSTYAE